MIVNFGTFSQILFLPSSQGYTRFTDQIVLTSAARLSFQDQESGVLGAILDNVSVVTAAASVPEPSSLVLCGLAGAVGLGISRTRRRVVG